jgi:phosphatidate cytidylyltransferase
MIPSWDPICSKTLWLLIGFFLAAGAGIWLHEKRKGKQDDNLRKRYFAWYMIAPVVLIPAFFGGLAFAVLVAALALYCLREFFKVVDVWETPAYKWIGRISGIALVAAALLQTTISDPGFAASIKQMTGFIVQPAVDSLKTMHLFYMLPVFIIMLVLVVPVFSQTYKGMLAKESFTILGILYFSWFLGHLVFLRQLPAGFGYIIFLSMLVVFNDVLAYTVGRFCGKTQLAPAISPKKTREGALGGLAGSILAAVNFRYTVPNLSLPTVLGAAVLVGLAAPLGDLVISVIKRDMAVKDSGSLIPGHGGLLDRCDSLIFATPVFYYYLLLVNNIR